MNMNQSKSKVWKDFYRKTLNCEAKEPIKTNNELSTEKQSRKDTEMPSEEEIQKQIMKAKTAK